MANFTLFDAQTSNASSSSILWKGDGSEGQICAWGTFDGGTVKLQASPDGGTTWIDIDGTSATANSYKPFSATSGEQLRADVSGGGGSLSVSVKLYGFKDV